MMDTYFDRVDAAAPYFKNTVQNTTNMHAHSANRQTPYDTGKIKIGSCYEPQRRVDMSIDMAHLQAALLHKPTRMPSIDFALMGLACAVALAGIMVSTMVVAQALGPRGRAVDCGMAQYHPDAVSAREACRKRVAA